MHTTETYIHVHFMILCVHVVHVCSTCTELLEAKKQKNISVKLSHINYSYFVYCYNDSTCLHDLTL